MSSLCLSISPFTHMHMCERTNTVLSIYVCAFIKCIYMKDLAWCARIFANNYGGLYLCVCVH